MLASTREVLPFERRPTRFEVDTYTKMVQASAPDDFASSTYGPALRSATEALVWEALAIALHER